MLSLTGLFIMLSIEEVFSFVVGLLDALGLTTIIQGAVLVLIIGVVIATLRRQS